MQTRNETNNFIPVFAKASSLANQKADLPRLLAQENYTISPTDAQTFTVMQKRHYREMCVQEDRHDQEAQTMRHNHLQQIMGTLQADLRELVGRLRAEIKARRKRHQEETQQLLEKQEQEIADFIRVTLQKKSITI